MIGRLIWAALDAAETRLLDWLLQRMAVRIRREVRAARKMVAQRPAPTRLEKVERLDRAEFTPVATNTWRPPRAWSSEEQRRGENYRWN